MEFHEAAEIFPLMGGAPFDELVSSIKGGFDERFPIFTLDGKILDGRNRYRACELLGVTPVTKAWDGADPVAFVIKANLVRRQLTTGQRAAIANELATLKAGLNRRHPAEISAGSRIVSRSQPEAAKLMGVSRESVQQARAFRNRWGGALMVKGLDA
jgi:hypothetical protein